ncbi:hypothetical protein BDV98DRAFT_584717 [Pterulicium gracile]|uniref:Uncharacterized protein n=1 Tax=Pterulicium gracile TaxID=1884261 RepID=A0A5C3QFG1_9AGAR|nr:hypothetical protein BDV98DRAFT_584717 [Pterula gracilis]
MDQRTIGVRVVSQLHGFNSIWRNRHACVLTCELDGAATSRIPGGFKHTSTGLNVCGAAAGLPGGDGHTPSTRQVQMNSSRPPARKTTVTKFDANSSEEGREAIFAFPPVLKKNRDDIKVASKNQVNNDTRGKDFEIGAGNRRSTNYKSTPKLHGEQLVENPYSQTNND